MHMSPTGSTPALRPIRQVRSDERGEGQKQQESKTEEDADEADRLAQGAEMLCRAVEEYHSRETGRLRLKVSRQITCLFMLCSRSAVATKQ